ncbi:MULTISPECIES: hypothetical protein [Lactobacillus]|uniref:Uncharacterized protein n=1 Tax=Lactobacillus johnsonii TaxID=33959 RepID=A0A9X4XD01_LACJH|nr:MULTISPECIES: hypothetical protein [Lactobacillus]MTE03630.1 hypothetical protein [Lactobacillus johnsonii]
MEQFVYSRVWYGRKIIVKKLELNDSKQVLAGYIELIKSDPKDWIRHAAVADKYYFDDLYPFDQLSDQLSFAGYLYDDKHLFIGFETQNLDKDRCIEKLKMAARSL